MESFVPSLPDVTNDVYIPNIFLPLHTFPTHGLCAMIALIATVLILPAFILLNTKQDVQELSPRDLLKNIKLANANKIVIGHCVG